IPGQADFLPAREMDSPVPQQRYSYSVQLWVSPQGGISDAKALPVRSSGGDQCKRVRRLSQDNQIKQRRAWLLLGWVTAERSCPCKQPACPAIGGGSEATLSRWSP
ncbi:hypothetical protein J6590_107607, partial [Homalodisca vitripennis]